ncbi:MAG: NfeD family protein [Demequinaceae bacterium]|nr:NfeD family protein [Demequinaceae bacterium]
MDSMWWFVGAILLGVVEIFTLDLTFLMCAGGAIAGGTVALAGGEWWVAALVAIITAGLLLGALRPFLLKSLRERTPLIETNVSALVGKDAKTLIEVTDGQGRVKLAGEVWSARTEEGSSAIPADTAVKVLRINGAIAIVEKK